MLSSWPALPMHAHSTNPQPGAGWSNVSSQLQWAVAEVQAYRRHETISNLCMHALQESLL